MNDQTPSQIEVLSPIDAGINSLEGSIAKTREKIVSLEKRLSSILGNTKPTEKTKAEVRTSECALLDKIIGLQIASEENSLTLNYIIDRLQV